MEVHIQTRKLIKPSTPTPNHLRDLKLSWFDQITPATYGSFVFFFPADRCISTSNKDERLEKLENSLSEVLTRFYPLAGRFDLDRNAIDCSDQGAEYLEARVNANLNQFILDELDPKLLNHLVPFPNELFFSPTVLAVQINKCDCGGLAIGVNLQHKFADGYTLFTLIRRWATCCRIGADRVECLSFETGSLLPAATYTAMHKIPVPEDNSEKLVTKRFIFTATAISALKAQAIAMGGELKSQQPSRVQVLIALIWKARIAVAQAKQGSLRNSLQIFPYNFRGKTALPIPPNAAGNLFRNVIVRFTADGDRKLELKHLVNLVGKEIRHAAESFAKAEQAEDLILSATDSSREIHEEIIKGNTDICVLTSMCRFPYYEADFGWGKPAWIASAHKPLEFVLLMDTRSNGGIEAWVTLDPSNMLQFEQDPDILAYSCKPAQCFSQWSSAAVNKL